MARAARANQSWDWVIGNLLTAPVNVAMDDIERREFVDVLTKLALQFHSSKNIDSVVIRTV
jgi:hypothetical protein